MIRESTVPEESLWVSFFDPPRILRSLLLEDSSADVVEFGCGSGTFTTPAAQMTGGTVHAIDVDPAMIRATKLKAKQEGLDNVLLHQRDFVALGTSLAPASVDYAMLFNILHAPEPVALLREAFRVLRPGGKVGIIHWKPEQTPRGPDLSIRPRSEQCAAWLEQAGFEILLPPTQLPPHHYGLVGLRPR